MVGKIKYWLRKLRAQGRFIGLIDYIIKLNALLKSVIQRRYRAEAERFLKEHKFGHSAQDWMSFLSNTANGLFRPIQQPQELVELIELVKKRNPQAVLEIGTANGGSLFLFCRAAADNATIVSIDLPGGVNGGGFPNWKTELYQQFATDSQYLHLLRMNSHHLSTFNHARSLTPSGKFEVIMIDADHSYEGVKQDFQLYSSLVADNGIIILHDIIENQFDASIQVNRFWNELVPIHKTKEIIFDHEQGNMGLGIVFF